MTTGLSQKYKSLWLVSFSSPNSVNKGFKGSLGPSLHSLGNTTPTQHLDLLSHDELTTR